MHTHKYTHAHTHTHTHISLSHACIHTDVHMHVHTHTHTHLTKRYMYAHTRAHAHAHTHARCTHSVECLRVSENAVEARGSERGGGVETGTVRASLFSLLAALTPLLHSRSVPSQPETLTNGNLLLNVCVLLLCCYQNLRSCRPDSWVRQNL